MNTKSTRWMLEFVLTALGAVVAALLVMHWLPVPTPGLSAEAAELSVAKSIIGTSMGALAVPFVYLTLRMAGVVLGRLQGRSGAVEAIA